MSQDFLSEAEVNALLRGVIEPYEEAEIELRRTVTLNGTTWQVIWGQEHVIREIKRKYKRGTQWSEWAGEEAHNTTIFVTDELYLILILKYSTPCE